jgi:hypothetical protein
VLRGLVVPAGKHKIEFKVNSAAHSKGLMIARISSWLIYLLVIGGVAHELMSRRKESVAGA